MEQSRRSNSKRTQILSAILLCISSASTVSSDVFGVSSGSSLLKGLGLPWDSLPTHGSNVSEKCRFESERVRMEADRMQIWALKILDASAKRPSGILNGNMNQYGDFDLCLSASESDVVGTYCLVEVDIKLDGQTDIDNRIHAYRFMTSNLTDIGQRLPKLGQWRWGVCVPSGCTAADISTHLHHMISSNLPATAQVQVQADPLTCYHSDTGGYSAGFYLTGFIFMLLACSLTLGTYLEYVSSAPSSHSVARCFSLQRNWRELTRPGGDGDDIPVVHGARFFNALALLLAHKKMAQLFNPFSNAVFVSEKMDSEWTMIGRAAILYTDSFLLISGLLTAYSMIKSLDRDKKIDVKRVILNRYLRFTPNLVFLIITCTYLTEAMERGPMWGLVVTKYAQLCKVNMWRNLLYIHNYFGFEDMCLTNTHQLGIDMQLFGVSPLLLLVLWRRPRLGVVALSCIGALSTYLRYSVALNEQLSPIIHYGASVNRLFRTARYSYTLPTHRATVYILGLLLGYGARRGLQGLRMSTAVARGGWAAAVLAAVLAVFGPAHMSRRQYVYDAHEAAMYNALAPLLWCSFLAWAAVACWNNQGGLFGQILSWKYFSIFSRISYAFYLIQFPVFFYNVGIQRSSQHYTGILHMIDIKEFALVTALSVALTLAVDIPFQNVRRILLPAALRPIATKAPKTENNNHVLDAAKIKNHG